LENRTPASTRPMRDQLDLPARPVLFLADLADDALTWGRLAAWLSAGAISPKHPFRLPVVSTAGANGAATGRVVVLRKFVPETREVVFHTDVRSAKVNELRRDARCHFLFYDPTALLQLRLTTTATLRHADARARTEFDALPEHVRASYAGRTVPGTTLPANAPFDYPPRPPADEAVAFEHFAAVVCRVVDADALELHEAGHRRVRLQWAGGEVWITRIAP
jgi:pyridoxamine 5'-phosphate oxidase